MLIIPLCIIVFIVVCVLFYRYRNLYISDKSKSRRTHCSVCGTKSVIFEGQYCSSECKSHLAKSMDDWHDRFEDMD